LFSYKGNFKIAANGYSEMDTQGVYNVKRVLIVSLSDQTNHAMCVTHKWTCLLSKILEIGKKSEDLQFSLLMKVNKAILEN
jgi:hypothetical protein